MQNTFDSLDECFTTAEVSDGRFFAGEIFRNKLGGEVPDYGRHVVAFYRHGWSHIVPLGYQHVLPYKGLGLCGGGSVDGRGFSDIPREHCQALRDRGGVLYLLLRHVVERLGGQYEAFFVYCGDQRSREVCQAAGFQAEDQSCLMCNFHRPLDSAHEARLMKLVLDHGPF